MNTDRDPKRAEVPTITLMIAVLVFVVCLVANAVGDAPVPVAVTEDPFEVPPSERMAAVAVVGDTVDADISTSRADLVVERPASDWRLDVVH